jgi:conjugative relaxase-like TrwC/TraI family protein
MVASFDKIADAAAAGNYYEADDYWSRDATGQWRGEAASALGLHGDVDPGEFVTLLKGELPDGRRLGAVRHGKREHVPGYDLTMNAPKSVSIMALLAGDRRIIDAHACAVDVSMDWVERHAGVTRIRDGERVDRVRTGRLAIAQFLHVTARETENGLPAPHLHTHNVILNMSQDDAGHWRSLDARDLYSLQKDAGAIYHMEFAAELRRLGYSLAIAKDGTFEIEGVPDDVRQHFSERSAQIEAALAARGQTRATASAAEKAVLALATRAPKRSVDHATLVDAWRAQADQLGFDEQARRAMVAGAEARALAMPDLGTEARMATADEAVAFAAAHISEHDAIFSAARLEREAGVKARGHATHADIRAAIDRAENAQALVIRRAPRMAQGAVGYATREGVETERHMLAVERAGRGTLTPLYGRVRASSIIEAAKLRSAERGHTWTGGQEEATQALLMSTSHVTGLQGAAGTAKTSSVLATFADAARAQGLAVRAFAPTSAAAELLGRAINAEHMTVKRMLHSDQTEAELGGEAWIVDEASMLAASEADQLITRARDAGARLVLVGDVKQLGSVGAGRAFAQLQEHGMATPVLDQIVRQTNAHTREAVEAMLAGEAARAFDAIDRGGGRIVQHAEEDIRHALIARDFAALSQEDRARTLVLDPTRKGRQRLTDAIRFALQKDGTLGEDVLVATVLEPCGLTKAEAASAASYTPGSIVTFRQGNRDARLSRGRAYRVEAVDAEASTVSLVSPQGKKMAWSPARWGGDQAEAYTEVAAEFRTGDRLQFTRNNRTAHRNNGDTATVIAVDQQGTSIMVEKQDGERQVLDLARLADRHVRHGWVRTIHSAQGATADRVMAHLESFRANTVDAASVYVAISRAKDVVALYTDSRARLTEALGLRDGAQIGSLDYMLSDVELKSETEDISLVP